MNLPVILLMPSVSTSYTTNGHTYVSDGNGFVYNALAADTPGLTAFGGVEIAPRNNVSASSNPTAANDYTQLYFPGSLWENVAAATLYMCTAMGSTPGHATWTAVAAGSGTLIGDASSTTVVPTGASNSRSLANLFADDYNNVKTFGAVGNGSTDDTTAIKAALTAAGSNGAPVYFPAGTYKVTSSIAVDFTTYGAATTGIRLIGAGMQQSIIDGSATGGFATLTFVYSGGTAPGSRKSAFWGGIRDLGVVGLNNSGPVFQMGENDTSDALNSFEIRNFSVLNKSTNSSCVAARLNFVLATTFDNFVCNNTQTSPPTGAVHGTALVLNSTQFCNFIGGSFSTAFNGVHITDDGATANAFTFANNFFAPDIENIANNCVLVDIVNGNGHNSFYGGQFVWNYPSGTTAYAINSSAHSGSVLTPQSTRFYDINFAPANMTSGALYGGLVLDPGNYNGVAIFGNNYGDGVTPASGTPATGMSYPNATGQAQTVSMYSTLAFTVQINPASSGPSITVGGTSTDTPGGDTVNWGGSITVVLRPGYHIEVTSASGTVNWLWFPLPA